MLLGLSAYDSSSSDEEEKPVRQKKKISIPKASYNSSDEDEAPSAKKPNLNGEQKKTSGLFSKLPPPRNTIGSGKQTNRPLIPHVFTKKPATVAAKVKVAAHKAADNDVESDNEESVDFFSFVDKPSDVSNPTLSDAAGPATSISVLTPDVDSPPKTVASDIEHIPSFGQLADSTSNASSKLITSTMQPNQSSDSSHLDVATWQYDDRFKRIQGKANRKEKIEFIDVNADSALEGNKQLLLQQISEEKNLNRMSHSKKNKDAPSATSKRKHQMSYLIHQAKEREIELKNAWASGHGARQAARNRYGF